MAAGSQSGEFESMRAELLREGRLFTDPSFQAIPKSIYYSKNNPAIRWRRPTELCKDPKFIVENATRFDLDQGSLGDCWYIAGAATLATHKNLFARVVPGGQGFGKDYAGIFHFHFWRFGEWMEVIIDDKLPTINGKLVFCNNREEPREFWSALMEKAYAKIHGSYEALEGGWTEDALVDFTGGVGQRIDLTKTRNKLPDNFFDVMHRFYVKGSMMGSCIFASKETMEAKLDNGLVIGHAYSVTKLARVLVNGKNEEMVRLRNPWGKTEWKGAWSDKSPMWRGVDAETRKQLGLTVQEDGEFWMSFVDWIKNFEQIQMCHLNPEGAALAQREWHEAAFSGQWVKGVSAGGSGNPPYQHLFWTNPQYAFTVHEDGPKNEDGKSWMLVSLMQKHSRSLRTVARSENTHIPISFDVFKVKDKVPKVLEAESYSRHALSMTDKGADYDYCRENTRGFLVEPGTYVVIPSTFAPDTQRCFFLRVYTETDLEGAELDIETGPIKEPSKIQKDAIEVLFHKYCGPDGVIDARELQALLNEAFATELGRHQKFELEACRSLVGMMDTDRSGVLEYPEVKRMWIELTTWQNTFHQFDKDKSGYISVNELKTIFSSVGYNVSRGVLEVLVRRYGGRDARLPFDDFVIAMSKVISLLDVFGKVAHKGKGEFSLEQFMQMTLAF